MRRHGGVPIKLFFLVEKNNFYMYSTIRKAVEVRKSPKQTENMHRMGLEYLLYLLIHHTCKNPHDVVGNMLIYCMGPGYLPAFTAPYIDIPPVPIRCTSLGFPALQDTSEEEPTLDVAPLISDAKVTERFEQLVGLVGIGR